MAGNASPMEALRYNETEIKTKKDHKKTGKVHPITMALSNLLRSKKKTVIVILSLSLSLILLNTMVTFFKGVDMDKYVQRLMIGDLQVTNASSVSGYVSRIKPEEIKAMKNADSIRECDAFYRMPASVRLTGKAMEKAEKLYEKHANAEKWEEKLEEFERTGDYVTSREFDTFLTLRNLAKGAEYSEKGVVTDTLRNWALWCNNATDEVPVIYEAIGAFADYAYSTRCEVFAACEHCFMNWFPTTALYYRNSASLLSQKINYPVDTYLTLIGYGGLEFYTFNYDDAEWAEYIAGNELVY